MNDSFDFNKIKRAGEIFINIEKTLSDIVKPQVKILDIAETIEKKIVELGGTWAFPVNTSIGKIAAHYTPNPDENTTVPRDDIIKIDFGVSVDGHIVDGARSFYFGDNDELKALVQTANEALNLALSSIKPNMDISELTGTIYDFVKERGFKTISNLHGHQIELWKLHGTKDVPFDPNVEVHGKFNPEEVYAIEIFVTNGTGYAESLDDIRIYSLPTIFATVDKRIKLPIHLRAARNLFYWILKNRKTLPFSIRHLKTKFDSPTIKIGLAVLEQYNLVQHYNVLADKDGSVAQAEDTILITREGIKVLTRPTKV